MPDNITAKADQLVARLLGRRVRVVTDDFDGYGEVIDLTGTTGPTNGPTNGPLGNQHVATIRLEVEDG